MRVPKEITAAFRGEGPFLIASHVDPDGDALGSALALGLGLESSGRKVFIYNRDEVPSYFRFLPGMDRIGHDLRPLRRHDPLLVLLDCNNPERSATEGHMFRRSIVIDHHETESAFGDLRWVLPGAAATGIMVFRLLKALKIDMTPAIATNLYTALAVDTGTFRYSNTSAAVLRAGAELVDAGADPYAIAERLYDAWEHKRFRLLIMALNTMEMKGQVAIVHVTREMFNQTGTRAEDTENFSSFPRMIGKVRIAVLLRELKDGGWKVSLRSKGEVNVAAIAERFGGGGHMNAAGFKVDADLAAAKDAILREAGKVLRQRS